MKRLRADSESTAALLERLQRERPDLAQRLRAALDVMAATRPVKRSRSGTTEAVYEVPLNIASFDGPGIEPRVSVMPPMLAIVCTSPIVIPPEGAMLVQSSEGTSRYGWMRYYPRDGMVIAIRASDTLARYVVTELKDGWTRRTQEIIPMQLAVVSAMSPPHAAVDFPLMMLDTDADLVPFKRDYT